MKSFITTTICLLSLTCFSQFDRALTLRVTGHFNFKTKGLATNDAGLGLDLEGSLFSKNRLQLLLETGAERFIGDKLLVTDAQGREAKAATIYSIKAGPQLFISKKIALSATYGPAWHSIRAFEFTADFGFRFGITGFFGNHKRFISKLFAVHILKGGQDIQYFGLGFGYRL